MNLNLAKVRKWITQFMTVVMVLASVVFTPTTTAQAAQSTLTSFVTATAISTIKYDFNIANGAAGSSITFKMTDSNWVDHSQTIQLTGNGAYSVSFDLSNASGIINMGYFVTDTNSSAVATLSKVTINGIYALPYNATLKVNSTWENGLASIWSGLADGTKIAETTNSYIAFTKGTSNLLIFYIVYPPAATTISTIKYDFNIANGAIGSSITFKMTDSNWVEHSQTIQLTGNGAYSVNFGLGNASGIINMGYFVTDTNSSAVATLSKVTVNGRYELTYNATLKVNSSWENALKNIWSGLADGTKIAEAANAYIAYTMGTNNLLIFYTAALSSQAYVAAMGKGFNVFNSFDSFNDSPGAVSDETSWGQPVVTKDYILQAKAKGFNSIRIPMTAYTRYTLGADGHYVIDSAWLARYKQVVDWAVGAGLYVMINIHHDSWTWLKYWDGNKASVEYKRYVDLWTQLANYFKDEPNTVCFETINEPSFVSDTGTITKQDKLNMINQAAHDVIRNSGGNNATRMIIFPTMGCNSADGNSDITDNFIASLNDPNIIATVHFYSDWVFSANLGITSFDEPLSTSSSDTARTHVDQLYNTLVNSFTSKGVGVIIGEYGWLAANDGPAAMQPGEKLKYFEYMNYVAKQKGICPMVWPGVFDRTSPYSWDTLLGPVVNEAVQGQRSSYSTGLNELYIKQTLTSGLQIPLTLNGNSFLGIAGLTAGTDYTYNSATATVTLSTNFVNSKYNAMGSGKYGTMADLVLQFSSGADWHQYLIKYASPVFQTATGSTTSGLNIPVTFNGSKLRRASAHDAAGNRVGPTSWFIYDKIGDDFTVNYTNNTITITSGFLSNSSVLDGTIKFTFEFYDGQKINYAIQKSGTNVSGIGVVP